MLNLFIRFAFAISESYSYLTKRTKLESAIRYIRAFLPFLLSKKRWVSCAQTYQSLGLLYGICTYDRIEVPFFIFSDNKRETQYVFIVCLFICLLGIAFALNALCGCPKCGCASLRLLMIAAYQICLLVPSYSPVTAMVAHSRMIIIAHLYPFDHPTS